MSKENNDLVEGFNAGYMIEQHRPELASQLVQSLGHESNKGKEPFTEGFIKGNEESLKERQITKSKSISKLKSFGKDRIPKPTRSKDRGKDGKGFEIDR